MQIIFAVDLVLGPLLTLIVFKAGKPGLKFDLTVIGVLQVCCLAAGIYIVHEERPLAVVYTDGRFISMSKKDYTIDAGIDAPDLRHIPGDYPKWVMVEFPHDIQITDPLGESTSAAGTTLEGEIRSKAFKQGRLISSLTEYYVPFAMDHSSFLEHASDIATITDSPGWQETIDAWLATNGGELDDYAFYTFSTRYSFGYLIFDKKTYAIVDFISKNLD